MRNPRLAGTAATFLAAAAAAAAAASFTSDPQQSRLEFAGVQAGAEFKGVFHKFSANVDFAPESLAARSNRGANRLEFGGFARQGP